MNKSDSVLLTFGPALTVSLALAMPSAAHAQQASAQNALAKRLLNSSEESMEVFERGRNAGVLELQPVALPSMQYGDNNHLGWPVAVQVDDALVVLYRRIPGHNASLSGKADKDTSFAMVTRSTDGGRTWSAPFDLRDAMVPELQRRFGILPENYRKKFPIPGERPENPVYWKMYMNAVGTTRDGAVIAATPYGVFRSEDQGVTWQHIPAPFRSDHYEGPFAGLGPCIIDTKEHGLFMFAHFPRPKERGSSSRLGVFRSRDGGRSWEDLSVDLPNWLYAAEPNAFLHQDTFYLIVRDQKEGRLAQVRYRPDEGAVAHRTNMPRTRSVDTSDLIFNPVTKRFECIQSDRSRMDIVLFSIAPQDWDTGQWRRESTLLDSRGNFYSTADGFHTGGGVVDAERGVHHIFFFVGGPGGPAGVFRLTRTLDTPKLAAFLTSTP